MVLLREFLGGVGLFEPLHYYELWRDDRRVRDAWLSYARKKLVGGVLFDRVEVETLNRCNGSCSFCPVHRGADPRPLARMTESLYDRILDELSSIEYDGFFCLFSNNEPLLDKRLISFARRAKKALPRARHYLYTNGSLLTRRVHEDLSFCLDYLVVDDYGNLASRDLPGLLNGMTTRVVMRNPLEKLTNRAGQAPNRISSWPQYHVCSPCPYPYSQMVIRPGGKLSLCCNDALGRTTMGNLNEQSMVEAWHSKVYVEARKKMLTDRQSLCPGCDTLLMDPGFKPF